MKKMLLVEDDILLNESFKDQIQLFGYEVDSCFNGKEALELLKSNKYLCIFSDVKMPIMDGIELSKKVTDTPILLFSGYTEYSHEEAQKIGASALFDKPIRKEQLKEIFSNYVDLLV